jgi:hypothetical protein
MELHLLINFLLKPACSSPYFRLFIAKVVTLSERELQRLKILKFRQLLLNYIKFRETPLSGLTFCLLLFTLCLYLTSELKIFTFFFTKEELGLLLADLRVICKNCLFGEVTKLLVRFCVVPGLGLSRLTLMHPFLWKLLISEGGDYIFVNICELYRLLFSDYQLMDVSLLLSLFKSENFCYGYTCGPSSITPLSSSVSIRNMKPCLLSSS